MSLVTPQGRTAQRELQEEIALAVTEIKKHIRENPEGVLPVDLLNVLVAQNIPVEIGREAMWQVVDHGEIELNVDRTLTIVA